MSSRLVGVLVLTAPLAFAQEPTREGGARQATPVFEAGTELVRLDLVVRDEDGHLIRDLGPDEIQVFEDGQLVSVSSLRFVDADGADQLRARPISSPRREEGPSASPRPANAAVSEDVPLTSVVVLLFDTLQGRAAEAAQKAALQFIDRPFPENTWFGVFKATRVGLVTLHAFTDEPQALENSIRAATRGADVRYDQSVDLAADTRAQPFRSGSPAEAAMAAVLQQMADFENLLMREERGRNSLYPLLTLARSLRGVQGRKTLLHFSQGIEVTPDIDHLLLNAISEANRSNLAVYTFDARGLFQESPFSGVTSALRATIPAEAFMGPAQLSAMQQGTGGASAGVSKVEIRRPDAALDALRLNVQENLRELAEGTSGFLVANNNDLRPGLERVSRDLRAFYEIAYVPPNPEADGTFRSIEVEVARAGARVRVRKGYYALPPGVPVIHPWEVSLAQALERELLPRELPLRAGAVRLAPDLRASRAVVLVEVPLGTLQARVDPESGHWSTHVSTVAFVKDAEGRVVARLSQDWPLEGRGPTSGLSGRNVLLKRTLDLAPGRYTLEAAAQDRHGGHLGARRVPFLVPEPAPGPALGSVSVVRFQPAPPERRDSNDPLLLRGPLGERTLVRALPVLGAPIPIEAGQLGLLASLRPDREAGPFSVTVEFRRDGRLLAEASPEIPRPDPSGHITLARVFDLPSTQPGRYQVHVRMRQGDQEVSTATSFRLARADPFGVLPGVVARR